MTWPLYKIGWMAALISGLAWSTWRGGREERLTVRVLALATVAALLHQRVSGHRDMITVALDGLLLAFFVYRAGVTDRWWPLYACAAQIAVCVGLVGLFFQDAPLISTYRTFQTLWSYGILLALVLGTALEQTRVREDQRQLSDMHPSARS